MVQSSRKIAANLCNDGKLLKMFQSLCGNGMAQNCFPIFLVYTAQKQKR